MRTRVAAALLALLAGCPARAAEPETTPSGKRWRPNRLLRFDYLVWSGGDRPQTVWLDADGRELGRADGILVALRGTVWRLQTGTQAHETYGCAQHSGGVMRQETLQLVGPAEEVYDLAYSGYGGYGVEGGSHRVELLGQVGRYWFLAEHTVGTSCGGAALDDRHGLVFDMVGSDWQASMTRLEDDYHRETRPVWTDGALTLEQRTGRSAGWRPVPMGNALEEEADLPEPVRRRLSAGEGPVGVSYGLPDARWKRVFGATAQQIGS